MFFGWQPTYGNDGLARTSEFPNLVPQALDVSTRGERLDHPEQPLGKHLALAPHHPGEAQPKSREAPFCRIRAAPAPCTVTWLWHGNTD